MKKYCFIIALLLANAINIQAQDSGLLESLFGNDQGLIEKALMKTAVLVRQDYVVKDSSGVPYGQGSLSYYGRTYGIGIVTDTVLWVPQHVRQSWIWDAAYTPYKDTHTAVPSEMAWSPLEAIRFSQGMQWEATVKKGIAYGGFTQTAGAHQGDSLPKVGRLAVFYINKGEKPDSAKIQVSTAQLKDIQWEKDGTAQEDQIKLKDKQILGGALFTEHTGPASISFQLSGLYVKTMNLNKPWRIHRLEERKAILPMQQLTPPATAVEQEQKSAGKKKKRKKKKN